MGAGFRRDPVRVRERRPRLRHRAQVRRASRIDRPLAVVKRRRNSDRCGSTCRGTSANIARPPTAGCSKSCARSRRTSPASPRRFGLTGCESALPGIKPTFNTQAVGRRASPEPSCWFVPAIRVAKPRNCQRLATTFFAGEEKRRVVVRAALLSGERLSIDQASSRSDSNLDVAIDMDTFR